MDVGVQVDHSGNGPPALELDGGEALHLGALRLHRLDLFAQQQQAFDAPPQMRGAAVTSPTAGGPLENYTEQQQVSAEDIRNMSMEQYAKMRPQLLGGLSNQVRERGVYG